MGHQVIKLQNPLKTLGFLQFYRFKTVKDRGTHAPAGRLLILISAPVKESSL